MGLMTPRFIEVVPDEEQRRSFLQSLASLKARGGSFNECLELQKAHYAQGRSNYYYRCFQAKDGIVIVGVVGNRIQKRLADILDLSDVFSYCRSNSISSVADVVARNTSAISNMFFVIRFGR